MTDFHKGMGAGWFAAATVVAVNYIIDQFMPPDASLWGMALGLCVGGLLGYGYLIVRRKVVAG